MNLSDKYMVENIYNIATRGYVDENPRAKYSDGTPAHAKSVNHVTREYDLSRDEFPICTLRPIAWKTAIKEILWIFQNQSSSLKTLKETHGVNYWDNWESKDRPGTIGQRYGATVDKYQLTQRLIDSIKNDPDGRRKVVSLWQEEDFKETDGLLPCALMSMWNVRGAFLDMCLIQRSGDMLVASGAGGINEIQYVALQLMIARHCGYLPGKFTHFIANEQIYDRHFENAAEMARRYGELQSNDVKNGYDSLLNRKPVPQLILKDSAVNFWDMTIDDFSMVNYEPVKPQLQFDLGI